MTDPINPNHYRSHPSGVECILIAREFSFCLGNVIKYVWRAGLKTRDPLQDLRKAERYLQEEIARLEKMAQPPPQEPAPVKGPPMPPPFVGVDGQRWNGERWLKRGEPWETAEPLHKGKNGEVSACGNFYWGHFSGRWIRKNDPGSEKQFDNAPRAAHDVPTNGGGQSLDADPRLTHG